ncbi:MAG: BON domain-containing protein [Rhodospirillaceae bacterium]|nr:BON domain-containing protein [Rhodospirillaceae bacterium]
MAVPGPRTLMVAILAAALTYGCSPVEVAVGAGAATGVAASQERGILTSAKDTAISFQIQELWFRTNHEMFGKLSTSVSEGRALLTGKVQDPEMRVEAVKLAWQVDGIAEVINEIEVVNTGSLVDSARDFWITTQLRGHLTFDKDIRSINYSIDTVNGTVFLMGIARDQAELDRVTNHARNLAYVRRVVSYVRVAA